MNNNVLDTQVVKDFGNGQYLVWRIKGHGQLAVTADQGEVAVSGIFFDPLS